MKSFFALLFVAILCVVTTASVQASNEMYYHYNFDENTLSTGTHQDSLLDSPDLIEFIPGAIGSAINVRAINYTIPPVQFPNNELSVAAWIKPDSCGYGYFLTLENQSTFDYITAICSGGTYQIEIGPQGGVTYRNVDFYIDPLNTTTSDWHHVAIWTNGSDQEFWYDGVQQPLALESGNTASVEFSNLSFTSIAVGTFPSNPSPQTVATDELRVYNYRLTQNEVSALVAQRPSNVVQNVSVVPPSLGGGGRITGHATTTVATTETTTVATTKAPAPVVVAEPTLFDTIVSWLKGLFA